MNRQLVFFGLVLAVALLVAMPVVAEKPSFAPSLYADGEAWGTKFTTLLPAPNGNNAHSFDLLFDVFLPDGSTPAGQLGVAEAAPGNPAFNGGRWFTHSATWTQQAVDDGAVQILMSYPDVLSAEAAGYLVITQGSPAHPDYFQCPLLPVKE